AAWLAGNREGDPTVPHTTGAGAERVSRGGGGAGGGALTGAGRGPPRPLRHWGGHDCPQLCFCLSGALGVPPAEGWGRNCATSPHRPAAEHRRPHPDAGAWGRQPPVRSSTGRRAELTAPGAPGSPRISHQRPHHV